MSNEGKAMSDNELRRACEAAATEIVPVLCQEPDMGDIPPIQEIIERYLTPVVQSLVAGAFGAVQAGTWSDDNLRMFLSQNCIWDESNQKWVSPNEKTVENLFAYIRRLVANPHVLTPASAARWLEREKVKAARDALISFREAHEKPEFPDIGSNWSEDELNRRIKQLEEMLDKDGKGGDVK